MKTADQTKASKLIQKIKTAMEGGEYSRDGTTWTLANGRLDQSDDSTGNWRSIGKMSLMAATAYVARTVGGWIEDSNGSSLEGDVIDMLKTEHNWD